MDKTAENTDREIWREKPDDYYAPSIHVTKEGGIGIDVGGTVIVMDVRDWHAAVHREANRQIEAIERTVRPIGPGGVCCHGFSLQSICELCAAENVK